MFLIIRPIRLALKALIAEAKPGQLALGFALGVLIGLVPKGNLIAIVLGVVLAASRANLGIAAATIVAVSVIASFFDPVTDTIGHWLLALPALQGFWTRLYNMPLLPWTDFNNTIVLGSFVLGMALLYPMYWLSKPVFRKYADVLAKRAKKLWLTKVLLGVEWSDRLGTTG